MRIRLTVVVPAVALLVGGCFGDPQSPGVEYVPNMVHSVAYDSFAPNPVTARGQTLRPPVAGTVPRGHRPFPYGAGPEEAARAGRELENPLPETPAVLVRGRHLYETYCQVCHGETGAGDGPLVPPFPAPPSYTTGAIQSYPPGRLYHVITRGVGQMPSYAAQIPPDDRWRLVTYVQLLQRGEEIPR